MTTASLVISGMFGMILCLVGIGAITLKTYKVVDLEEIGFDSDVYLGLAIFASVIGFLWLAISFINAAN